MAQKTAWTGAAVTETDINTYLMGEGGAWTSWTPTVTQSVSVTVTTSIGKYARYGRTIIFRTRLTVTGSGTASNLVAVSLPVTAASSTGTIGAAYIYDSSAALYYGGLVICASTTSVNFVATSSDLGGFLGAAGFTAALAVNDVIEFSGTYESAT